MTTSPESGVWMPPRILISVDLPAPFSPSSATISPRPTFIVTFFSAFVPPKDLLTRWKNNPSGRDGTGAVRSAAEGGMRWMVVSVPTRQPGRRGRALPVTSDVRLGPSMNSCQ